MPDRSAKKKRPWLKILNKEGTCIRRCKNPELLLSFLVHVKWPDGSPGIHVFYHATRLLIDDVEYNAPIRTFVMGDIDTNEPKQKVLKELLYLIDTHMAFYD